METPGVRAKPEPSQSESRKAWQRFYDDSRRMRRAWLGCEVCPPERRDPNAWLEIHHVISQQRLKRLARDRKLPEMRKLDLLTDPRNSIVLCRECHHRHTVRNETLPLSSIPAAAWDFARELGIKNELVEEYR